jgi:predicted Zn-dependent peptidase
MKIATLSNGIKVVLCHTDSATIALQVSVNIGSNNETDKIRGISHFIEHMLFEGTKNRGAMQITAEIEGLGGEIGAFTSNERTCFYIRSLRRNFSKALDVLSDILCNSLFKKESIEKERKIILSEVNMRYDEPRFYQWQLFEKTLFKNHPIKYPVIGFEKTVKSINQEDIIGYYESNYIPKNIIISVCGDTKSVLPLIKEKFSHMAPKGQRPLKIPKEPKQTKIQKKSETRQIAHSYMVIGYKTVPRSHKDSYILDLIRSILGRPLSGRLYDEVRNKRGLAYDVGAINESGKDYGFFACYISTNKKNIPKAQKILADEFQKVVDVSDNEIQESKNYLEGEYVIENEDISKRANSVAEWEFYGNAEFSDDYIKEIKKVKKRDIQRVVKKYFTGKYAVIKILQKTKTKKKK